MIEQLTYVKRFVFGILFSKTFKMIGNISAVSIASICTYIFLNHVIYHYFFSALTVLFLLSFLKSLK